jgi:protein-disulfide isomerase
MEKEVTRFLLGALAGVCVTVAVFYVRGPLMERQAQEPSAGPEAGRRVNLALRSVERSLGSRAAPLTLVEFSDYECPYCAQFNRDTFPEIKRNYIDTGKLRFVHRDLPLPFHKGAREAAQAALCADEQGAYWAMRDALLANSECLRCEGSGVLALAKSARLDVRKLAACLSEKRHADEIRADIASAQTLKIDGTPTFVLGRTTPEGVEGLVIKGAQPYSVFESELRNLAR